ncbi:Sugar ABC transporter substrate-binding protein [Thermobacillus xylanilyticus]|uniref:Sugar ABC transporter substrate-binding protein n=1 Tax=Thermobacillus xylanilyticus TaxID=76633 RepID=A0ABM8V1M4_THEXY|nr:extracellular solute-binding protein [Thermobacillus xylanilyticus]CAG5080863.1 Sugar ABC transporter substrate-binding protein [Thermobacillus xylanilyticus]
MRSRRIVMSILTFVLASVLVLAGCSKNNSGSSNATNSTPNTGNSGSEGSSGNSGGSSDSKLEKWGLDENLRFKETRKITVEIYDRGNDGGTPPEDNFYTDYIKEGMLRDHNVEVEFVPVPRWTEGEVINNLLAANQAPDISVTYSYPTIQTYANMGGVLDLAPYLEEAKDILPDLWDLLTDTNIYWDQDPKTGTIWALEARLAVLNRINTFVREDWLKKLNMEAPTNLEEFENMLKAFRDNASLLLGDQADKMIPFAISFDVGWRADHLTTSFVPDDITDKDLFVYGFDDRKFLLPNYKEAIRVLNKWYHEGLIWKDFSLYPAGDPTEDNLMKAGYVGAFIHNWDYPYRNGEDSIHASLQRMVGPDAAFVAIETFPNDAGVYRKFLSPPIDRKIFFPATNKEPIASLLYLNWISKFENRFFLQFGEEGVTHEKMPDGSYKALAATGEKIMNSPNNIDYTITVNGLDLGDPDLTVKSIANGYAGVDKRYIEIAYQASINEGRVGKNVNVGEIKAENGVGQALKEKRDTVLNKAIVAPVSDFDKVYDSGFEDYLRSGGQAIIDERKAKWEEFYGDKTMLD